MRETATSEGDMTKRVTYQSIDRSLDVLSWISRRGIAKAIASNSTFKRPNGQQRKGRKRKGLISQPVLKYLVLKQ